MIEYMRPQPQTDYQSYLLRLWRDGPHNLWHATLHCTASGEKYTFVTITALLAFLIARLDATGDDSELANLLAFVQTQAAIDPTSDESIL